MGLDKGFGLAIIKLTNSVNGAGGEVLSFTPKCFIHPAMSSAINNDAQIKYSFPVVAEMDDEDNYNFQATSNTDKNKDFVHEFEGMPPNSLSLSVPATKILVNPPPGQARPGAGGGREHTKVCERDRETVRT